MTQLFCLPFAGGSEASFAFLRTFLPDEIELEVLEYPGHGRRIRTPPVISMEQLVDDSLVQLRSRLRGDYLIYGHSLGAWVSYLLTSRICAEKIPLPRHLFLSGHEAFNHYRKQQRHLLSDSDFLELIIKMEGTPKEVVNCPELLEFLIPILRSDFRVMDTYQPGLIPPLYVPLTVFYGRNDPVASAGGMNDWCLYTKSKFCSHSFTGGHFFLYEHGQSIADHFCRAAEIVEAGRG